MTDHPNGALIPVWPITPDKIIDGLVATMKLIKDKDGQLVWVEGGKKVVIGGRMLTELIRAHLGVQRLVNRGDATQEWWELEIVPLEVNERFATALLRGDEMTDDRTLRALTSGRAALIDRVPAA